MTIDKNLIPDYQDTRWDIGLKEWAEDVSDALNRSSVNLLDYGGSNDGVTNNDAALAEAMTHLPFGGILYVPEGPYIISNGIIVTDGVSIVGSGATTFITSSTTGNVFEMHSASSLRNLKVTASVTRTSGAHAYVVNNGVTFDDVEFNEYFVGVKIGDDATDVLAAGTRIHDCGFVTSVNTAGSGAIAADYFADPKIDTFTVIGPTSGTNTSFGIRVRHGDTISVSNGNLVHCGDALLVETATPDFIAAMSFVNVLFDTSGDTPGGGDGAACRFNGTGFVYHVKFVNCWMANSNDGGGVVFIPGGSGVVDGVSIVGCNIVGNANQPGIYLGNDRVKNVMIAANEIAGNGWGVYASTGVDNFTIVGNRIGPSGASGANNIGVIVDNAGSNNYVIQGNDLSGNTSANLTDNGAGANKVVQDNVGASDVTAVASATAKGYVELATDAETQTGTDTVRAVTPASLASLTATSTRRGLVELATDAEAQTGTDTARAITPANLASVTATTSRAGLVETGTDTEFDTGTDTSRYPTLAHARQLGRMFRAANAAATAAFKARAIVGDLCYQADTGDTWRKVGSDWKLWDRPRTVWTPTWNAGITAGNGTWSAEYWVTEGMFFGSFQFTCGSTSAVTGALILNLPLARELTVPAFGYGGRYLDSGTSATAPLYLVYSNASDTVALRAVDHSTTYGSIVNTSATIPYASSVGTATNDFLQGTLQYPVNVTV